MPGRFVPLFPFVLLLASVAASVLVGLGPKAARPVAAIFPPWWGAGRAFDAAALSGASIVRFGALRTIIITASGAPALGSALRASGALAIMDAGALGACSFNSASQ